MSESGLSYGAMAEGELPAVGRILSHAFAGTREGSAEWIRKAGLEHVRVVRGGDGEVLGCLLRIPMGEFFGGRGVPMVGIAGVGVAPEARGMGVAGTMMSEAVREIADSGVPISGLYPATQPLYRRVGYEQAGHRFEYRLPLGNIDCRDRTMRVRAVHERDRAAVRACYRAFAACFDGPLDRGEYAWGRVERNWDVEYHGFAAVNDADEIEGYLYLTQQRDPQRGRHNIVLSDLAFTTARAGRRLLALLADFSSTGDEVVFFGGPLHPLTALLAEQRYQVRLRDHWMIRITDLPGAISARGYRRENGEVHLDVRDPLLPRNEGRWVVRVEGGQGVAERGGRGDLRVDINAMASLYSGLFTAEQLAQLGRCDGDAGAVRAAAGVFAGGAPWMSDMY